MKVLLRVLRVIDPWLGEFALALSFLWFSLAVIYAFTEGNSLENQHRFMTAAVWWFLGRLWNRTRRPQK